MSTFLCGGSVIVLGNTLNFVSSKWGLPCRENDSQRFQRSQQVRCDRFPKYKANVGKTSINMIWATSVSFRCISNPAKEQPLQISREKFLLFIFMFIIFQRYIMGPSRNHSRDWGLANEQHRLKLDRRALAKRLLYRSSSSLKNGGSKETFPPRSEKCRTFRVSSCRSCFI